MNRRTPKEAAASCRTPNEVRAAAGEVLHNMLTGRVSWLWAASVAAGVCRRQLARQCRRLVFLLAVQPVFVLVQLLVYVAVRWSDAFRRERPPDQSRLPRATVGNGKVAVIIPNYQGEHYLGGLLESLARQTWPNLEVLIVDNDSRDGSEAVARRFPNVRWIANGANLGFASAVNRGACEAGDAEFLALLNNDTVVEPDWARRQIEALRADPRLGMVGARIYQKGFDRRINVHAHVLGSDLRSYNLGAGEDDRGQFDSGQRVLGVSGCSMMIRNESFWDVGGFDEQFFLCYEDLDFSLRLFWRGWDCRVVPTAVCHHVSNAHMPTGSALHVRNLLHHDLLWVVKNVPASLMSRYGASFLASVLHSDELRLFYHWQGWRIALWRLQAVGKLIGALGARRAIEQTRLRPVDALREFIRPVGELHVGRLYQVDLAERYLVSRTDRAPQAARTELFPQNLLVVEGFEEPADLAAGAAALTVHDDPQVHFRLDPAHRQFHWIDLELTCDQSAGAQFVMKCGRPGTPSYHLPSNHFRVLPGRHRYAFPIDGRFFLDHRQLGPDLFGYWRDDLEYLRLDPCESSHVRVAIHSFGVS